MNCILRTAPAALAAFLFCLPLASSPASAGGAPPQETGEPASGKPASGKPASEKNAPEEGTEVHPWYGRPARTVEAEEGEKILGAIPLPEGASWLLDEEGKEYFVHPIPKAGLNFQRVDDNTLRGPYGVPIVLAGEDDEFYYQKIFRITKVRRPAGPTPEDLAAEAATYEFEAPAAVDRLELVPFGEGLPHAMWRHGFEVADMNGDGHMDVVHATPRRSGGLPPLIFLGDGAGKWREWTEATFEPAPYEYGDLAVADWNGDGHMDLALGMHAVGMLALVNDGKGNFKRWSEGIEIEEAGHRGAPAFTSRRVSAADWNGDGRPDIVALAEGPRGFEHVGKPGAAGKVVYLNQGDGVWVKVEEEEPWEFGNHMEVLDMDGDGRLDMLISSSNLGNQNVVNRGLEDGTWERVAVDEVRAMAWIWAVTAADFDADGRQDFAYAYSNQVFRIPRIGLEVMLARDDGAWERRILSAGAKPAGLFEVTALKAADLDGDGHADLVATGRGGELALFLGDGKGGFLREQEENLAAGRPGCQGFQVVVADVDADGRPELVANFAGENCVPGMGSIDIWKVVPRPANGEAG